jgi:hypothetical protein
VAGLIGGILSGLIALPSLAPLLRNLAATRATFPDLPGPWITFDGAVSPGMAFLDRAVGAIALVFTGAAVVRLARPADGWADWSAGLSASLAASLAALVSWVGWPVVLALVLVPTISDLTFVCDAAATPSPEATAEFTRRYPELGAVEANRRGGLLMARIATTQATGAATALWLGVVGSLLSVGAMALIGTLAAGYLSRQVKGFRARTISYLELTLPLAITMAMACRVPFAPLGVGATLEPVVGMAGLAVLMAVAVVRQRPGVLRVCLALTWLILLGQALNAAMPWLLLAFAGALTAYLVGRHVAAGSGRPVPAT